MGWLCLAPVIDACSRSLLGWSITDHLRTDLCLDTIEATVATRGGRRNLAGGIVFTQTTVPRADSIGRRNTSMMEVSGNGRQPATEGDVVEARAEIFAWLNWYNTTRLHSLLDFRPPM
jgi:transposase InsO family protein